ncbi:MAG: YigZ family protein [Muribaculaceae bacterium]|nr:YigZ family protein [Muribaculaceae bacterium]
MPSDTYLTLAAPSQGEYKEKKSKFMAFARPVADVAGAKAFIASCQKEYFDARHVCWAYMLGADRKTFLSSDNGEPSGTAGKPILGQINSFGLTDVVVVVVRYFGGIKLGTSGLIAAYRAAAREALGAAVIVERHITEQFTVTFPYIAMNEVMRAVKNSSADIIAQNFDNSCSLTLEIRADDAAALRSRLLDIDGTSI